MNVNTGRVRGFICCGLIGEGADGRLSGPAASGIEMKPDGHLTARNRSSPHRLRFGVVPQQFALRTPHWNPGLCRQVSRDASPPRRDIPRTFHGSSSLETSKLRYSTHILRHVMPDTHGVQPPDVTSGELIRSIRVRMDYRGAERSEAMVITMTLSARRARPPKL